MQVAKRREERLPHAPSPCLFFCRRNKSRKQPEAAQGEAPAMFQLLFAPYYVAPGYAAKRGWSPMNEGRGFFTQEELNKQSEGGDYARQHYSRHLDAVPGNK